MQLAVLRVLARSPLPGILVSAGLVIAAATGVGEQFPKSFHENAEVSLVAVPVTVTAPDGTPIRGLTASDFELSDEGVRQSIEALDVVDLRRFREVGEPPWAVPGAARRHFLILFDQSYASPNAMRRARDAAARLVGEGMEPEDLAAVATVSVETGARLLMTFTADRRQLVNAIRSIGLAAPADRTRDPLAFSFPQRVETSADAIVPMPSDQMMTQKTFDDFAVGRVEQHLAAMGSLAAALEEVAGQKTIVYFSEGFDGRLLVGDSAVADNEAMVRGQYWTVDVDRRFANAPLMEKLTETLALFRRSDCNIYPIDIAGLRAGATEQLEISHRGEEALQMIAKGTGGEVVRNPNDLDRALEHIRASTLLTYVLSFRPSRSRGEGRYHRLKVRLKKGGGRVSGRAGYYETRGFSSFSPLQRALAAADVITHERQTGGFPMTVLVVPLQAGALCRVPVLIQIPGEELLDKASNGTMRLGFYVYAVSEKGEVGDFFTRSVTLDLGRDAARLREGLLRYRGELRLLPGRYRIRTLARDEDHGRSAFQAVSLQVAEPEKDGGLRSSPPLFLAGAAGGITLRDAPGQSEASAEPFEIAGEAFVPEVDPALIVGRPARLCLLLSSPAAEPNLQIQAVIVGLDGRQWAPGNLVVVGRTAPDPTGLWKIVLEFEPTALPAGGYRLAITLRDPTGAAPAIVREASFRLLSRP